MSVRVNLSAGLVHAAGGLEIINATGNTVGECLENIIAQFPKIREQLLNKEGKVRSYVLILLNGENVYPDELSKRVKNGDEISILFIVEGG